jgi:cyclopropane fatty-acyl-phospholipid synthase-like methyltransferase
MEKPYAPACERNRDPILSGLREFFHDRQRVLEIGSGTGQHAVHFAQAMPHLIWQASDVEENLPGIQLWIEDAGLANAPPPVCLDVNKQWPSQRYDAIFSANTLHIMSWSEIEHMFEVLPEVMTEDAVVAIYGPFNYGGQYTSQSNAQFDVWLRTRDEHSAIRDFEAVDQLAQSSGLRLEDDRAMPANNRLVLWRRVREPQS